MVARANVLGVATGGATSQRRAGMGTLAVILPHAVCEPQLAECRRYRVQGAPTLTRARQRVALGSRPWSSG